MDRCGEHTETVRNYRYVLLLNISILSFAIFNYYVSDPFRHYLLIAVDFIEIWNFKTIVVFDLSMKYIYAVRVRVYNLNSHA
jgi:hypothetical protein